MATANSRRGTGRSTRAISSSRLRTVIAPAGRMRQPEDAQKVLGKLALPRKIKGDSAAKVLIEVRRRLAAAEAVALVICSVLNRRGADVDHDAVLALQRCVADEGDRQIEEIDRVIALCLALERKSAVRGDNSRACETSKA
jgi:hypothetical protein